MDLSHIGVVDNHCHAVELRPVTTVEQWRALFSESTDLRMRTADVADTAYYRRLMSTLAGWYDVPPDDEAVLAARSAVDPAALTGQLFREAGIEGIVVDTGFPDPAYAMGVADMAATAGCVGVPLLRLELRFQELVARCASYDELVEATRADLLQARERGYAGFKSIAAYRTGLDIRTWPREEAEAELRAARNQVLRTGAVRLGHQPLLDSLLHVAFGVAAQLELPVQFHVGYGDPDVDLRQASPLLLRAVLEEPRYRDMPVVLLHGCWPYVREAAYLAAVYGNAHLDLSYGIPFLSRGEMRTMTQAAFGAAPVSKLMYSSDGVRIPELHWLGAHDGRRAIGEVLDELVDDGDLTWGQAGVAAELVLRDNAHVLYGTGSG